MNKRTALILAVVAALAGGVLVVRMFTENTPRPAPGWSLDVFATGLPNVDNVVVAAGGLVYATMERETGQIVRLTAGGEPDVIYGGLDRADGLILHEGRLFATEEIEYGRVVALVLADLSVTEITRLQNPEGVTILADGTLAITEDVDPGRIVVIAHDGTIGTLAGGLQRPEGLDVDANGILHVAETMTGRVLRIDAGVVETVIEGLTNPDQIAFHRDGSLWITEDADDGRLLRWHDGTLETIADNLYYPQGIDFDADDRVYVSEQGAGRILIFTHE